MCCISAVATYRTGNHNYKATTTTRQPQPQDNHKTTTTNENEKSVLIRVICGEKSLSLHIAKLKTTKITLYNGK